MIVDLIVEKLVRKILNQEGFESFGKLEIDHFIPWAFIASHEIWNLTPTFKKVNLDKSNNLPDLNVDLKLMAHQHHVAIGLAEENKQIKKLLDSFLNFVIACSTYFSRSVFVNILSIYC